MIEHKFRVWDKVNKEWAPYFYLDTYGELVCEPLGSLLIRDNFEVNKCTGMYDKNMKEIYDGDIVCAHIGVGCFKGPVVFKFGAFFLCDRTLMMFDHKEVIGNIYEHPELLEKLLEK